MSLHRRILLPSGSNGSVLSPPPSRHVPSNVIIAVTSAAAAFLFLAIIYYAVLRHRHRRPPTLFSGHDDSAASSAASDHPIWHIKTLGLDAATIDSLGSYAHLGGGDRTASGCAVCLGELLDGEIVRLLPKCSHVFHVQCIDTWLLSHVSCPLCRAAVVDEVPTADVADVDGGLAENPQLEEEEEEEQEEQEEVRVSVVEVAESSGVLRSASMEGFLLRADEEKGGNCSNGSKEEALEKGQSESGRGFLFSRLRRARSSSVLPF